MSNRRHRRRFYPEFYTDEELRNNEQSEVNMENMEQTENIEMQEEPAEEIEEIEEIEKIEEIKKIEEITEDNGMAVENLFDRTKKPREIKNPGGLSGLSGLSIEIPQDMYIRDMPVSKSLSVEENEEIHNIFDTVAVPTFAELHEEKIKKEENTEQIEQIEINPGMIKFDVKNAIEYARRWALDRNPNYYDFEDIGGDCTNYISQILLAGGCKMDKSSVIYGWYYNNANDKSPSWTGVEQLYDYLIREKEHGIIAHEIDLNEVETGDIAQISFNGKAFQHTPFIISVKRNSDNSVSYDHIKICAHSFDSENRAIDTYQWKKIRFIRIDGYRVC